MDSTKASRLKALTEELAAILYEESDPSEVTTLEGIEKTVRGHLLEHIGPQIGNFLFASAVALAVDGIETSKASSAH